jgi:hypothetical protein
MAKGGKQRAGLVRYTTHLRADQIEALREVQGRDGVPAAEQIRRALDAALGTKRKVAK